MNNKTKKRHHASLRSKVQGNIEKNRTAVVHGADDPLKGGRGINAKAITQDELWEYGVFLGPGIIKIRIEESYKSTYLTPKRYYERIKAMTDIVLAELGGVLEGVEQDVP